MEVSQCLFERGDVLTVINSSDSDWWRCELRGKQGIVPRTYVVPL